MVDAALAMNTDWLLIYADMGGDGLLAGVGAFACASVRE
jgi:hypothetical protein